MPSSHEYRPRHDAPVAMRWLTGIRPIGFISHLNCLQLESRTSYEKAANRFCTWAVQNQKEADLSTLVLYVDYLHEQRKWKSSTIQSMLSAVRVFFLHCVRRNNRPVVLKTDCPELQHSLDQWAKEETVKKSEVFLKEEYEQFVSQPTSGPSHITQRLALVLGVHGCFRRCELWRLKFEDISFIRVANEEAVLVQLFRAKRRGRKVLTKIAITGARNIRVVREYLALFREDQRKGKLFRKVLNPQVLGGSYRISEENIGINTIGKLPYLIALGLGKPPEAAKCYTGHTFRRTGATILAEAGCTVLQLQEAGGWNSASVATSYIAASNRNRVTIAHHMGFFSGNLDDDSGDDASVRSEDEIPDADPNTALILRFRRTHVSE